jgi:indole-3-glycerol phosphate synthase/phosphoribosylanthranilate isomerase
MPEQQTVLDKIVADKRILLQSLKRDRPLDTFIDQLTPSDRDFHQALSTKNTAFILECKKASPSKGLIRDEFDLNYIAGVYLKHANAISVLTDEKYFQGKMAYLKQVRDQVTQPVICKDFIVDPYQIYLGRLHGADAILLMLSVLTDDEYASLAEVARSLQMGILTEISNAEELQRAIRLDAKIIGINNRNLRDLSIDLNKTLEYAPQIPSDRLVISESGIYTHQQVRKLAPSVTGFLIGSSLMEEQDLDLACRKLIYGENKVCGLTRREDAIDAAEAGIQYGGLIFYPPSPRNLDLNTAKQVTSGVSLKFVGVFVDEDPQHIADIANKLKLAAVQLHGKETAEQIIKLRQCLPDNCEIWKAHRIDQSLPDFAKWPVDRHLLDSYRKDQPGGTGHRFDWRLLEKADNKSQLMLAGGLTPELAGQAAVTGVLGLDFNSGVEDAAGIKSQSKLAELKLALRAY